MADSGRATNGPKGFGRLGVGARAQACERPDADSRRGSVRHSPNLDPGEG